MQRTANLCALFVVATLLSSPTLNARDKSAIPQRFHAEIGGFKDFTYNVELKGGRLRYTRSGGHGTRNAHVRPTTEQWREFRRELDAIDVWRWRAQYSNYAVVDGTQWSLDLTYPDKAIRTQGSNDYPGATPDPSGVPSASKMFTRYLKAIQRLLGGRAFE